MASLIGTWSLIGETAVRSDGSQYPLLYGPKPLGITTFTADLRVAAVLSDGRVEAVAEPRAMLAFCGSYDFNGVEVSLHVDRSTIPEMITTPQVRHVTFEDDTMSLTSMSGQGIIRVITWRSLGTLILK